VVESLPPVAILAGGLATRLRPVTLTMPKSMIEVAGEPFIAHQLRLLAQCEVRAVVICAGHLRSQIENYVGEGIRFGCTVRYSVDGERPLGTGGALRKALPLLAPDFMVLYGDSYLPVDLRPVYAAFRDAGLDGLMTVFRNEGRFDSSNVDFDGGRVLRYNKQTPTPDMKYIDYGLGILRRKCLLEFGLGQPFDLAELYSGLAARQALAGYEVYRRFFEIGSPAGLAETRAFLGSHARGGEGFKAT
jgi:N-acetyl-alpha-D-muramate 1-phosphate uridylyltransferase